MPFATVTRAAAAISNPGDRVIVAPGTYSEGDISPARGGGPGRFVEFRADTVGDFFAIPGRVVVRPPANTGTGFIVIGQVGVSIAGFTIIGGRDAGIQVRSTRDGEPSSDISIRNCAVRGSARRGIDIAATGPVVVSGNTIEANATGGIVAAGSDAGPVEPVIENNSLIDNGLVRGGHGIFVRNARDGLLQNNEISGSGLTGVTIRDAAQMRIVNNLVTFSGAECNPGRVCGHGIAVGTGADPVAGVFAINNTVYGNHGWGFLLGTNDAPSNGATLLNNIFAGNTLGGIAVSRGSTCGYIAGFNLNPDGYGPDTPSNDYDLDGDPAFADPDNADFRLRSAGPTGASPAIDAGSDTVAATGLTGSATVSGAADTGRVDLGYHAGASPGQDVLASRPFMPLFVRTGGSDLEPGLSPGAALASIGEAADRAAAGVIVVVGPGTYTEQNIAPPPRPGVVVFYADSDGAATDDAPGIVLIDAGTNVPAFLFSNVCEGAIDGFHIRGGETGVQVRNGSDRTWVTNNVIFSARNRGVDVVSSTDVRITNNLIYDSNGGVQVIDSPLALIANNTIYGHAFNGIFLQDGVVCARVRYNVIEANLERGLLARSAPQIVEWNLNNDGYLGLGRPATDRTDSALLVDPAGADGVLGGNGFADDLLMLSADSPAIDLGPLAAEDTELAERSTTVDGEPDRGPIDAGYHYPAGQRDPSRRVTASAFADAGADDTELCDMLLAEETPTPGTDRPGNSGGGSCAVVKPGPGTGWFTLHLALASIALLLPRRRRR